MSEKFNITWSDFCENVSKSFGLFRNESYLHDVTLVSDDFKQIPAHKLVLSATSEYFKNILQETKQSQPLICLDGVNAEDLRNVLDYVYDGEVQIEQDNLDRFLNIAQKLKLEGITGYNIKDESNFIVKAEKNDITEETILKPRRGHGKSGRPRIRTFTEDSLIDLNGENVSEEDHNKRLLEDVQVNPDKTSSCKVCGKLFEGIQHKRNAKRHVEIHIDGLTYKCSFCSKNFRSKHNLEQHLYTYHK